MGNWFSKTTGINIDTSTSNVSVNSYDAFGQIVGGDNTTIVNLPDSEDFTNTTMDIVQTYSAPTVSSFEVMSNATAYATSLTFDRFTEKYNTPKTNYGMSSFYQTSLYGLGESLSNIFEGAEALDEGPIGLMADMLDADDTVFIGTPTWDEIGVDNQTYFQDFVGDISGNTDYAAIFRDAVANVSGDMTMQQIVANISGDKDYAGELNQTDIAGNLNEAIVDAGEFFGVEDTNIIGEIGSAISSVSGDTDYATRMRDYMVNQSGYDMDAIQTIDDVSNFDLYGALSEGWEAIKTDPVASAALIALLVGATLAGPQIALGAAITLLLPDLVRATGAKDIADLLDVIKNKTYIKAIEGLVDTIIDKEEKPKEFSWIQKRIVNEGNQSYDWWAGGELYNSIYSGGELFNPIGSLNQTNLLGLKDNNVNLWNKMHFGTIGELDSSITNKLAGSDEFAIQNWS